MNTTNNNTATITISKDVLSNINKKLNHYSVEQFLSDAQPLTDNHKLIVLAILFITLFSL